LKVACPTCGQPAEFAPSNRWRPFCSERCRSIDLGAWASEAYAVPAKEEDSPGPEGGKREE
jgi:endogenous inhibitor of DNA gyrase (YacG/DUF329 family)